MTPGFPMNTSADLPTTVPALSGNATSSGYTPTGSTIQSSGTGTYTIGPYTPDIHRSIYLDLWASTSASGSIQIVRSRDSGATQRPITKNGVVVANYAFSGLTGTLVNETIDFPESSALTYYIKVVLTAGSIAYAMFQ